MALFTPAPKTIIGRNELVSFIDLIDDVPAKVDTGADSSSVWVSDIDVDSRGHLSFCLFDKTSPRYTGQRITRRDYKAVIVRSASGHEQLRYQTKFKVRIAGRRIHATFNLSDRSKNLFPVLIGRRTLHKKFLVDVSIAKVKDRRVFQAKNETLNQLRDEDPHQFHQHHYKKSGVSARKTK